MKNILFLIIVSLATVVSAAAAITGISIMTYNIIHSGPNFFMGFEAFSLGIIMASALAILFYVTKISTMLSVMAETLSDTIMFLLEKNEHESKMTQINPFKSFLDNFKGSVQIGAIDQDGQIKPLGGGAFNSVEEFLAQRDSILGNMFGIKPEEVKKKLEDMSVDELKQAENDAVKKQQFERAAACRDAISRKEAK